MANYPETQRNVQLFARQAENDLKALIKSKHNDTGNLASSIKIVSIFSSNSYRLSLEANDYILYLDNGRFIDDFLKKKNNELADLVIKWITIDIEKNITEGFDKGFF